MKNKIIAISTVVLGAVLLTGCGSAKLKNGEEVVFSVNGKNVTADKFYKKLRDKYAKELMIDVIDKKILDDVYKNDADIEKQASNSIESIKNQYSDNWEETLKNAGYDSEDDLKDEYILNFQRQKAIDDYIKENISDAEIKKYYKEKTAGDIRCKHILISVKDESKSDSTGLTDAEAKKKAEELIKKLDEGANFDDLAKENSNDTGSASKGGDLGYFNKGDMVEEFETAAYKLKKNEYTKKPVKTSYGYHIILKTDEKGKAKLSKVKDSIIETLVDDKLEEDPKLKVEALDDLRKSYKLKFKDSKMKKLYKEYIDASIKSAEKSKKSNSNTTSTSSAQ